MQHLTLEHKTLSDRARALGCFAFAFFGLLFAGLYLLSWEQYHEPDYAHWVAVPGKVTGDGSSWKPDNTLLRFGVRFTLPNEVETRVRPVYADIQAYRESGIRTGSPVTLTVEPLHDEVIVREVVTPDGRVLYDDSLYYHVVSANNNLATRIIVALPIASIIGLVLGGILWFRNEDARVGES